MNDKFAREVVSMRRYQTTIPGIKCSIEYVSNTSTVQGVSDLENESDTEDHIHKILKAVKEQKKML